MCPVELLLVHSYVTQLVSLSVDWVAPMLKHTGPVTAPSEQNFSNRKACHDL